MERKFETQQILDSWIKSCKVVDDVDQEAKDVIIEALELKIAEEQGLLLRLQVKPEDRVWCLKQPDATEYYETEVTRIEIYNDSIWLCFKNGKARNIDYIGKTVFLTKEEAEKKLAEMKEVEHVYK
jgi:Cu/Ag efflux protein CusF